MSIAKRKSRLISLLGAAVLSGLAVQCGFAATATSSPLAIVQTPLFLGAGVKPNLIMAMDDSGSMDFEVLLPTGDGAAWWLTAASGGCSTLNSFTGCARNSTATGDVASAGAINFNVSGGQSSTWVKFAYLFPNGCDSSTTSYQRRLCDGTIDHFAIPPVAAFSFFRSPDYNPQYFNPNVTYNPWVNGGGYTFSNATATAARFDPVFGTSSNALDLTKDVAGTSSVAAITTGGNYDTTTCTDSNGSGAASNYYFQVYTGMTLPAGTCFYPTNTSGGGGATGHWQLVPTSGSSTSCAVGTTNGCNANINGNSTVTTYKLNSGTGIFVRYFPATFYLKSSAELPADYGYTGATLTGAAPDGTSLVGYEIKPANFSSTDLYNAAIQNFANWFSFDRKRHQALRSGLGAAFNPMTGMRISGFRMNNLSTSITMGDIDNSTDKTTLYKNFYSNWIASGGTPTQHTINTLIANFKRTDSAAPVQYSCQKNFGFLFTDGYANDPGTISVGNIDGNYGSPYADSTSNTIADAVMNAYVTPLRTGTSFPTGQVGVPAACSKPGHDASLDCNTNLHMNFYTVTLGTKGVVFNPDAVPAQDPYASPPTWPTSLVAYNPVMVDDLWHATINSRGLLLNAKSGDDIATKLAAVLRDIIDKTGSAASASVNSGSINSDTRVFQAQFNSTSWSGELLSFRVLADGTFDPNGAWQASTVLPAADSRNILTVNSSGTAVPFRWSNLSSDSTRTAQLQQTDTAAIAQSRVDYLRGVRTQEQQNGGTFRNRASALGDIINSAPVFVGAPAFRYSDTLESVAYSTFKSNQAKRTQAVYVGANDGMLHAFRADTGAELFAFIPGAVFGNLYSLTQPTYTHRYYVDGSPTAGDAFFGGSWHTVLTSGLNAGGQSIFALDITTADGYTEGGTSNPFLWEFTDAQDADLGDTFARPSIVRMHNGHWAVIFGNGYNNTASDNHVSSTGDAVLYVVDLATGALLRKIDTGKGFAQDPTGNGRPNGLATAAVVDANSDGIADYAYAGDLFGNLWKFDLTDSDPSKWVVSYKDSSGALAPLYVAVNDSNVAQPITSKPSISRGPNGQGFIVLFGTGKYLESGDTTLANLTTESFYGIIDQNTGQSSTDVVSGRSQLTKQQITTELTGQRFGNNTYNVRLTTNNTLPPTSHGWYIDLVSPANGFEGEMQVTDSIIRENQVIFTTLIPNTNPCSYGGRSWLMALNLYTGSFLDHSPWDLNGDGSFDSKDYATGPNGPQPVSGIQTAVGITPKPADLASNNGNGGGGGQCPGDYLIMPGTTGQLQTLCRNAGPRAIGRQSWRQVR